MASRGVNKVILIGNLGSDPEVRYMPNGDPVTSVRLATSEVWKDQSGQQQERTEWHRVVFFRGLAKVAADYLRKGGKVYIEGHLRTQQWEKNGEKRYSTEIIADEMQMLDRAGGGVASGPAPSYGPPSRGEGDRHAPAPEPSRAPSSQPAPSYGGGMDDGFDDDIPF